MRGASGAVSFLAAALAFAAYLAVYQGAWCAVRGFQSSAADVVKLAERGCARQVELFAASPNGCAPLVRVAEAACRGRSQSALKAAVTAAADPRAVAAEALPACAGAAAPSCPTCCAWLKREFDLAPDTDADACALRALRL